MKKVILWLSVVMAVVSCTGIDEVAVVPPTQAEGRRVVVLEEGNFNAGNAELSVYTPATGEVEHDVFRRTNQRRLGDTGQSLTVWGGSVYVAVENSGIIWRLDEKSLQVTGQLEAPRTEHMTDPRYIHVVSAEKAYATDLMSPFITVFNPTTMAYMGSIATGRPSAMGYASTEEMAAVGNEVFAACWSYDNKVLVVDTRRDAVTDTIALPTMQPRRVEADRWGTVWVATQPLDGAPHLYGIDAKTHELVSDETLPISANVDLAMNAARDTLYIMTSEGVLVHNSELKIQNAEWRQPYAIAVDPRTGELYVADAGDYAHKGRVWVGGHSFEVGINPGSIAFVEAPQAPQGGMWEEVSSRTPVDTVWEYTPAPGHQVNGFRLVGDFIHDGATPREAADSALAHLRRGWMTSLGAAGGYIVAGWNRPQTGTLCIQGNPYSYQSEPGIIWTSTDVNHNGLPDDPWHELPGSAYGTQDETFDATITYYPPTAAAQDIRWTSSEGDEGVVPYLAYWNAHPSYYPDWLPRPMTFRLSRLRDKHTWDEQTQLAYLPPYAWGYADNAGSDTQGGVVRITISEPISFVKVQTAVTGATPTLGECSTEVYAIWMEE